MLCNMTILSEIHYSRFVLFVKNRKRAAPPDRWSGPPRVCSAGAAAASAAGIGVRIGRTAYAAARAAAAPAAAPAARRRTGDRTALLRAGAGTGAGGIRGRRAADRAGRLSAAGIAAPLLDKVWEYEAAEAAVAGISHFISLHKRSGNVCSRVILCRKCPNRAEKQQNPDGRSRPGIGCKNRKKTQRLENCGARRAAFKPYFFLSFILGSRVRKPAAFSAARNSGLTPSRARETP